MPDTLAQMESDLVAFEKELEHYSIEFSKATSDGGVIITPREKALLNEIEEQISKAKKQIMQRVKESITIDNILDRYQLLFNELMVFISSEVDTAYLNGCKVVIDAGTCYAVANDNFQKALDAQQQHLQDLANIEASIISVIGGGALAWLSSTGKVVIKIGRLSQQVSAQLTNTLEDAVQIGFDKVVSYKVPQLPSYPAPERTIPQVYQNMLSKQLIDHHIGIRGKITEQMKVVNTLIAAMGELKEERSGNSKAEYQRYTEIKSIVHQTFKEVRILLANSPKPFDNKKVEREFERALWAEWLPTLKTINTSQVSPTIDEFGVRDTYEKIEVQTESYKTSLASELKERLITLDITTESGAEIKYWTSLDDVHKLIAWSDKYTLKRMF